MTGPRDLVVHNRHGMFVGNVDRVDELVRVAKPQDLVNYMNEAGAPSDYSDVTNWVELAIMVADITTHVPMGLLRGYIGVKEMQA